jgi:hypothetical protein
MPTAREKYIASESNTSTDARWQILLINYTVANGTKNEHVSQPQMKLNYFLT